jgi:hypothetical protein
MPNAKQVIANAAIVARAAVAAVSPVLSIEKEVTPKVQAEKLAVLQVQQAANALKTTTQYEVKTAQPKDPKK